ncbi:12127_t:CDS:2 [Cetraspora pellucida]|uniref:12127_t:CDS:1 n=1 Tax=Cetraspora pellucida TaxID=1433469 RepID=A0ACA9MSS6_9GLOM|nr:12127_t:CDS:2 [Cetraspora pellucida]
MNNDFSSTYLQSNSNNAYSTPNSQQINPGYETRHLSTYPWLVSEQQTPQAQAIIPTTSASTGSTSSKGIYITPGLETNGNLVPTQNTPIVGSSIRNTSVKHGADSSTSTPANASSTNMSETGNNNPNNNRAPEYGKILILEVNFELIRVCIDYHTNKWPNEELTMYKMRLQANLAYLAMVADEYNGNPRNKVKPKIPDLSPLPIPRGSCGQNLNNLIQRAVQVFSDYKKFHRSEVVSTTVSSNANHISHTSNNITSNISPSTVSDGGTSTSPRQYKLPTSSSIMGSVLPSSSQYQQMYQKQQPTPQQMHPPQQLQVSQHQQQHTQRQSSNRFSGSIAPSATMAATYQRHSSSLQPNMVANNNNMTDYTMMTSNNSEQPYQVLPPLVGIGGMSIGNAGNSNANNGQGTGILPSLIGLNDQFGMPISQQQQQQLQNVGFTGFMSGNSGISSGAGFGTTNTFGMAQYPSANGSSVMNNGGIGNNGTGLASNNNMGSNGIGVNALAGNGYGSNSIAGNTSGLPNMLNHDNGM